jgi:hypothetical protein
MRNPLPKVTDTGLFAPIIAALRRAEGRGAVTRLQSRMAPVDTSFANERIRPSTRFHRMLIRPQPHPEEARRAVSIARGNPRAVVGYTVVVAHPSRRIATRCSSG